MHQTNPTDELKAVLAKHDEFAEVLDDIGATLDALQERFKSLGRTYKEALAKVSEGTDRAYGKE